jgi:hypothetical protein
MCSEEGDRVSNLAREIIARRFANNDREAGRSPDAAFRFVLTFMENIAPDKVTAIEEVVWVEIFSRSSKHATRHRNILSGY